MICAGPLSFDFHKSKHNDPAQRIAQRLNHMPHGGLTFALHHNLFGMLHRPTVAVGMEERLQDVRQSFARAALVYAGSLGLGECDCPCGCCRRL